MWQLPLVQAYPFQCCLPRHKRKLEALVHGPWKRKFQEIARDSCAVSNRRTSQSFAYAAGTVVYSVWKINLWQCGYTATCVLSLHHICVSRTKEPDEADELLSRDPKWTKERGAEQQRCLTFLTFGIFITKIVWFERQRLTQQENMGLGESARWQTHLRHETTWMKSPQGVIWYRNI